MSEVELKTDQELVALTLKDKSTFRELVVRYEAPLRRYVKRIGAVGEDVSDVLQEIFIKVFVNLNDYDPKLKFSSWIYRIAHNETISLFRKKNVRPGVLNMSSEDVDDFFEQLADEEDFVELAHQRDDARIIRECLEKVSEKYRAALILRFLEEKSYGEIGDILKIPEGTVATLINRGKKELKVELEKRGIKQ